MDELLEGMAAQALEKADAAAFKKVEAQFESDAADANDFPGLQDSLERLVTDEVVAPLCTHIETELRITIHKQADIQLDDNNPFKVEKTCKVIGTFRYLRRFLKTLCVLFLILPH